MEKIIETIEKYLKSSCVTTCKEVWVSKDIYNTLNLFEYKGFKIFTNNLMPYNYIVVGKIIL